MTLRITKHNFGERLKTSGKTAKIFLESEHISLLRLLQKYEPMFYGTLGIYTGFNYKLELQEGVIKPCHAKHFPIPKMHKETIRKEVHRLIDRGVLKHVNNSVWDVPTFIGPKKNGTIWYISDCRALNTRIK